MSAHPAPVARLDLIERRFSPLVPEITLDLARDVTELWRDLAGDCRQPDECFPYWAVAWAGGQALARYLLDHPDEVTGRRVLDFAAGSGLCAIAAMLAGAAAAHAVDIDPLSREAIARNARSNGVTVSVGGEDPLVQDLEDVHVVLAGDVFYERDMAARVLPWLERAHVRGVRVLVGDPGREFLPRTGLVPLAEYRVPTPREVEGVAFKRAAVYAVAPRPTAIGR